jgi:uncharacterized integral membrane protein
MEMPAMAVGGNVPTLSPLLLLFLLLSVVGGMMLVAALLLRNLRLLRAGRLHPFKPADLQAAANPQVTTRPPGAAPFVQSRYARVALGLLSVGITGMGVLLLVALFAG